MTQTMALDRMDSRTDCEDRIDPQHFREVFGHVPTSVSVVSGTNISGDPVGLTVGSLVSVSLEPPLVSFCVDKGSTSWPQFADSGRFVINVLSDAQAQLCSVFATKQARKFDSVPWHPSDRGLPVIDDALVVIDCDLEAVHEAGDHEIVVARVRALRARIQDRPLLFHRGNLRRVAL